MQKNLLETLSSSQKILDGKFLQVMQDTVICPDSTLTTREYIQHPGAAAIIALTKNKEIVLEYQYRHPVNQVMIEIPAGKIDPKEPLLETAKRELQEETGYTAKTWILLGSCFPCIGYSNEKITYFLAKDLELGNTSLDAGEFVETFLLPIEELLQLIYDGKITDGKTLCGIMLYQSYQHKLTQ